MNTNSKKLKMITTGLLGFVFLFTVSMANAALVQLDPVSQTVNPGDNVFITVKGSGFLDGVSSGSITVNWDPLILSLNSVSPGPTLMPFTEDLSPGVARLDYTAGTFNAIGLGGVEFIFANLDFTALAEPGTLVGIGLGPDGDWQDGNFPAQPVIDVIYEGASVTCQSSSPVCPHPEGHLDYCRDCGPCAAGEGDCDIDNECESGLTCVQVPGTDTCQASSPVCPHPEGHLDYCRDCGPCAAGEGDCDIDNECESGLTCVQVPGTDTCQASSPICPHPVGHLDYCRDCGPCDVGQGDCDNDGECQSGLTCVQIPGTDTCQ